MRINYENKQSSIMTQINWAMSQDLVYGTGQGRLRVLNLLMKKVVLTEFIFPSPLK